MEKQDDAAKDEKETVRHKPQILNGAAWQRGGDGDVGEAKFLVGINDRQKAKDSKFAFPYSKIGAFQCSVCI